MCIDANRCICDDVIATLSMYLLTFSSVFGLIPLNALCDQLVGNWSTTGYEPKTFC